MREGERHQLSTGTGELDSIARLAQAQRDVKAIAHDLLMRKTSRRPDRQEFGRQLNAVAASLRTVELRLGGDQDAR